MEERKLWLIVFIWAESNNALPRGNRFRKIEVQKACMIKKPHRSLLLREEMVKN